MTISFDISANDLEVPTNIPHMEKVEKYRLVFNKLAEAEESAKKVKKEAKEKSDAKSYLEADVELERMSIFWTPFMTGAAKAQNFQEKGHLLANPDGEVTPPVDGYIPDAIVTLFLIISKAIVNDFLEKFGNQTQDLIDKKITLEEYGEAIVQLTPGLRILQDFRDQIIPKDDNGEIAKLIRDPVKRPIEIIQNIRNGIISPSDNGEIARIIRDPIKRPVEVVTNVIKNIFGF